MKHSLRPDLELFWYTLADGMALGPENVAVISL